MGTCALPTEDLDHVVEHARDAFLQLANGRIFITGGTGFFGHWLLESLLHANLRLSLNIRASVLTRDARAFRDKSPHIATAPAITLLEGDVRSFRFPSEPHTHILHAATDSAGLASSRPAYELAEDILDGTRHVLRFGVASGVPRLLYISTGAVYGRSTQLLYTPETYTGAPDPLLPQSSYDEAKRMAENLCVTYAVGTALQPVIARCFAFVGPHLPLDSHFAIGNFLGAAIQNQPIHIHGDGTSRRSWLYMADLAIWLWTLLARGESNRAYNVGSDEAYTIAEAARLTALTLQPDSQAGSPLSIKMAVIPDPSAPLNSYVPSVNRVRAELGLQVTIPLAEALRRTARWHGYNAPPGVKHTV